MSVVEPASLSTGSINHIRRSLPSKRKLDDYASGDLSDVKMRKSTTLSDVSAVDCFLSQEDQSVHEGYETTSSSVPDCENLGQKDLQFFVRVPSKTLVIHCSSEGTVESVHRQIWQVTGIPMNEQRLIYGGRQLQWECTLAECGVESDSILQLTCRLRSTGYPRSWLVVNDLISSILSFIGEDLKVGTLPPPGSDPQKVETLVKIFLMMCPKDQNDRIWGHLEIFNLSGAPAALVMLYASRLTATPDAKKFAEKSIRLFLNLNSHFLPKYIQAQCAPILLEFCKLLSVTVDKSDPLYVSCRSTFGSILSSMGITSYSRYFGQPKLMDVIAELFPFVSELAGMLSAGLSKVLAADLSEPLTDLSGVLAELSHFFLPLRRAIIDHMDGSTPIPVTLCMDSEHSCFGDWFRLLHAIFVELLEKIDRCLGKLDTLISKEPFLSEDWWTLWSIVLLVLTELNGLSKIFAGAREILHSVLMARRIPLNALIRHAKRNDNLLWLLKHKNVMDFDARRNLVMMMFQEGKEDYDELHEMLIDRSHLLSESFEYIAHADPNSLQNGLFMEFKNEEATGPGVLREWFCLICRALFDPQNVLFIPCPNDQRRFFPNPSSVVDPLHLEYFAFCGRVIALALMHKVQVGIVLDRVFFQQLAGKLISLDDVRDADPYLYMSCKKILEMDAEILDSDTLGLTFVREIEELGSRRAVELCPGGKDIIVNSRNRHEYVNLLIRHCFVTSISEQVTCFSQGFSDILSNSKFSSLFFQSLDLEDFDQMIGGSDKDICTRDWKAHTEYNGYKANDRQISWFWKVVEGMSAEQRKLLLFFWTSVKYLPVEGFGGLDSKLYIYKTSESHDHLPTSHTCFYRICLPAYPSLSVMRERLQLVTQEHVSCSFGIW